MTAPDLTADELAQLERLLDYDPDAARTLVFRLAPSLIAMAKRALEAEERVEELKATLADATSL